MGKSAAAKAKPSERQGQAAARAQGLPVPGLGDEARGRTGLHQGSLWARGLPLQTKLVVNQAGDLFEQEADQAAEQVMRMPDPAADPAPAAVRRCACGGIAGETGECPACRAQRLGLSRKSDAAGGMPAPSSVDETLRGSSQPLDAGTRSFMEARFGQDFGGVRIHQGEQAAQSARDVSARAYTVGQDIVFGQGQYAPSADSGKQLLAHELAHVVQQQESVQRSGGAADLLQRDDAPPESGAQAAKGADPAAGAAKPPETTPGAKKPGEEEPKLAAGSWDWPLLVLDPVLFKLPDRWRRAVEGWKPSDDYVLFDPALGRKLAYSQFQSLINLAYAGVYTGMSPYKPDFSKALSQAEALSGVSDTYLNLAALALRMDLKKYLEKDLSDIAIQNLAWVALYGLMIQGGLTSLNYAMESDLDFTTLLKPAVKKWTDAPAGFSRPYTPGNLYDPRWSSPFLTAPSGFEIKVTGFGEEAKDKPYTFNFTLGANVASMLDLYPKDEKEKEKYKGFELFPYFNLAHSWAKEGQADPALRTRWLAGAFVGGEGVYTLIEGGQQFGADGKVAETYAREGLFLRALGPLALLQLTSEQSLRPETTGLRTRLNAASTIRLLDNETWKLTVGGAVGGVLPKGSQPGALDVGGQVSFYHQYKPQLGGDPMRSGVDISGAYRPQDLFAPESPRLFSLKSSYSLLDYVKLAIEYHHITGSNLDLNLPVSDTRFMLYLGPSIFRHFPDVK